MRKVIADNYIKGKHQSHLSNMRYSVKHKKDQFSILDFYLISN